MKTIEVLICDDHEIFRNGIKSTLRGEGSVTVIAEGQDGAECLELLKVHVPDIVLLDINMPIMDGIECLQRIKANYPFVKVIALTQFDEKRFVKQMLKHGADGYILKSTTKQELMLALNTVMRNKIYLAQEAEQIALNLPEEAVPVASLFTELSSREREIVHLLCHEFSTKQIADKLGISFHTVESHRANLFRKLGVQNIAGLVRWAVNNGLD